MRETGEAHVPATVGFRVLFALAAAYNLAFGLWGGLDPQGFFRWFALEPPRYPSIWGCLAMVVGLYGVLYGYVAWRPERGAWIAAVGLAGKVLGPLGWLTAVHSGELPPRTFPLILANDLVWWFPFLAFLLRGSARREALIAWATVAIHLAACAALLAVRGGTEAEPDVAARFRWVAGATSLWVTAWWLWTVGSLSLLAFCVAWASRLAGTGAPRALLIAGCGLVAVGLGCDLMGEVIQITRVTRAGLSLEEFESWTRAYNLLGPGAANGLYCVGGLLLSAAAWRCGWMRGAAGTLGVAMWCTGLLLTGATLWQAESAMLVLGAGVMILFLAWGSLVAWRLEPARLRRAQNR